MRSTSEHRGRYDRKARELWQLCEQEDYVRAVELRDRHEKLPEECQAALKREAQLQSDLQALGHDIQSPVRAVRDEIDKAAGEPAKPVASIP